MGRYNYTEDEQELIKVLKYNQDKSNRLLNDSDLINAQNNADSAIQNSEELLKSLGSEKELIDLKKTAKEKAASLSFSNKPEEKSWDSLVDKASKVIPNDVEIELEDILSPEDIQSVIDEYDSIEDEFSRKTSIVNKTDLIFLGIATALQVTKSLVFPYVAEQFGYGDKIDKEKRLVHNDKKIEDKLKEAKNNFKQKYQKKHEKRYWYDIITSTVPYDTAVGSPALGINLEGGYHRVHTLGHDPILGWIFGTADILTYVMTLSDFRSFRVNRHPIMITPNQISLFTLFKESYDIVNDDFLNLPAAIFAQAQHLKSDEYTKLGLPVPILEAINETFASELYKSQYDSLCLSRDVAIIGSSFGISLFVDIIISLVHRLFRKPEEDQKMYEVRTRKILLISNALASTSTIISSVIQENPKALDIGSLLSTVSHLFRDVRFITKLKKEFIQKKIDDKLQIELDKLDSLYDKMKN